MTQLPRNLSDYPLSRYFLQRYLSWRSDQINFPPDMLPDVLQAYENLFADSLKVLSIPKESLRARPEFNFDSGDPANLEGGIAELRVVCTLESLRCDNITIVRPSKNGGADVACERIGRRICCEVKAITKQSRPRKGYGYDNEVYEKVLGSIGKARSQLDSTARELRCSIRLFACVMNWQIHPVLLGQNTYFRIAKRLERDGELSGIDGLLFLNNVGEKFMFLTEVAHSSAVFA